MASSSPGKKKKKDRRGISLPLTIAVMLVVGAVLFWRGLDYYPLNLNDQASHPDFRELRPSGDTGYFYGVVGTLLIFTNLLYLARRKLAGRRFGSMRTWLDLHVFTGLVGSVFVAYHASFHARNNANKVTAVSLVVVLFTGIVGRFLYALIPRPGKYALKDALEDLEEFLPGMAEHVRGAVAARPVTRIQGDPSLLRTLGTIPRWRREARDRRDAVALVLYNAPALAQMPPAWRKRLRKTAIRDVIDAAGAEVYGVAADALLRSWRPLHRLFAIVMICTVILHIAVAWYYGYRWIFSE